MIKQIGTKIYYCLLTGNVIKLIGDMQGYVVETNFDEDYGIYTELKERDKNSIGLLTLEYGEYTKLSKDSTGVMVDLETKELIFSYDEFPIPPQEPTLEDKVEEQAVKISILTQENEKLKISLATVEATHSDLIFDIDFRVMDLEDAVGVNPVGINFNLKGGDNMNSTFVMLLSKIENGYYDTREEIEAMADRYLARKRISVDEYDILMSALDKKEAEKNPVPEA